MTLNDKRDQLFAPADAIKFPLPESDAWTEKVQINTIVTISAYLCVNPLLNVFLFNRSRGFTCCSLLRSLQWMFRRIWKPEDASLSSVILCLWVCLMHRKFETCFLSRKFFGILYIINHTVYVDFFLHYILALRVICFRCLAFLGYLKFQFVSIYLPHVLSCSFDSQVSFPLTFWFWIFVCKFNTNKVQLFYDFPILA